MPVLEMTLIEGYDSATKARLITALTRGVRSVIAAPLEGVTIVLKEVKPDGYARGGRSRTPGPPLPSASDLVAAYLKSAEERDLAKAETFLAPGFTMTFPGGHTFTRLQELVAFARDRYRFVRKTYERFDEAPADDGTVVYCHGTLAGEWIDGAPFVGIRFVDRFTVRDGKLADQLVWNDLAEYKSGLAR